MAALFSSGNWSIEAWLGVITYSGLVVADIYNTMRVSADAKAEWGSNG